LEVDLYFYLLIKEKIKEKRMYLSGT
jgi:hypothetical protein